MTVMSRRRLKALTLPLGPLLALTVALLMMGAAHAGSPGAPAQAQAVESARATDYEFFTTIPETTYFDFTGEFALPQGFFDRGSARFDQRVSLKGVPIRTFQGRRVGDTDTVVARFNMPRLGPPYPSRGTAQVELAALSLASIQPISVTVGGKAQLWDLKLQLSRTRPPRGKMEIVQQSAEGGTFDSELMVFPVFTFVRQGDGAKRVLDVGRMKLGPEGTRRMTLSGTTLPWSTKAPDNVVSGSGADRFHAGVREDQQELMLPTMDHHGHFFRAATLQAQ